MQIILIIIGAVVGLWLADISREFLGMVGGGLVGLLLAQRSKLQVQINELAQQLRQLQAAPSPQAGVTSKETVPEITPETEVTLTDAGPGPEPDSEPEPVAAVSQAATPTPTLNTVSASEPPLEVEAPVQAAAAGDSDNWPEPKAPGVMDKAFSAARSWLTTGNVPVKIGVVVSFFGVAFLLKYAVDQQMLSVPIELRYLAVAIFSAVMLGVGWRLRNRLRVYALSLQGGGIGVLFLTIFGAFRLHPLIPAPFAFFLLVALTAAAGVLAVVQNARALAVLGIVGGFLAPVLISTGSGNHVGLFTYYLLLNAAVLGIAWFRAWRFLNVIAFVFTFGVGTLWGAKYYQPELLASTEPFLIVFFLFYQAIAILFAFRQKPKLRGLVDGTLVFGTPVVAFALQSQVVAHVQYALAISAICVAVLYTLIAVWLHRRRDRPLRLLVESYIALGVAFATIAVPLALDNRWTAVAWALEGAALVWIGVRQQGLLAKLTGTALLVASGVAFVNDGWTRDLGIPVFNGNVIGGLLIAVASLFSARYLAADARAMRVQWLLSVPLMFWGLGWWLVVGALEIADRVPDNSRLNTLTLYFALSGAALAWLAHRLSWVAARRATLGFLPLVALTALLYRFDNKLLFDGFGWAAWLAALLAHGSVLFWFSPITGRIERGLASAWHFAGVLLFAALLAMELALRLDLAQFGPVWSSSAGLLMLLLVATALLFGREPLSWPLRAHWPPYLAAAGVLVGCQLVGIALSGIEYSGNPAPLPYIPLFNPFDLLTAMGLVMAVQYLRTVRDTSDWLNLQQLRIAWVMLGIAAFALSTLAVVRGVHQYTGVRWDGDVLLHSVAVQSALSIYWASLGFAGMIQGARRISRPLWLVGTGLMALVVVKLFLVDLGNTGTVARIVSFLGVGLLLLVVGYLAPAPPKQPAEAPEVDP